MAGNEDIISVGEPIVFENKTESNYEVYAGIVFHNSGIYKVSVDGNRTIVSKVAERKKGKWIKGIGENGITTSEFCSCCRYENKHWYDWNFCPNCGADMRGDSNE